MTYELAKKLKDAGWKFRPCSQGSWNGGLIFKFDEYSRGEMFYAPTLEELIEACGVKGTLFRMNNVDGPWTAETDRDGHWSYGHGSTPTEAVARLWLALNEK